MPRSPPPVRLHHVCWPRVHRQAPPNPKTTFSPRYGRWALEISVPAHVSAVGQGPHGATRRANRRSEHREEREGGGGRGVGESSSHVRVVLSEVVRTSKAWRRWYLPGSLRYNCAGNITAVSRRKGPKAFRRRGRPTHHPPLASFSQTACARRRRNTFRHGNTRVHDTKSTWSLTPFGVEPCECKTMPSSGSSNTASAHAERDERTSCSVFLARSALRPGTSSAGCRRGRVSAG